MSDLSPSLHPEVTRLSEENAMMRDELAQLLAEAHDLVQTIKPNLLAIYQSKIGTWELRLLRLRCEAARLKRMVELAQAALNRGKQPDWMAIEGAVELEFLEWQAKIRESVTAIEDAECRMKNLLSPQDSRELKKLYYALVKQLHPDLNPNVNDDQRRLWLRVQAAHDSGDIEELRVLSLLSEKHIPSESLMLSLAQLRQEQESLRRHIASALARIEEIESVPPFTMRKKLTDQSWIEAQRTEIERQIVEQKRLRDIFREQVKMLRNTHGHGKQFGAN